MANDDRINEVYYGQLFTKETQQALRERVHWICAHVQGEKVLDIGCSQGIVVILLGREGFAVTGVDIESAAIAYAQAELQKEPEEVRARVSLLNADVASLNLASESFDSVILGEVIERLLHPERVLAVADRVLKPGGRLIVTTPFGVLEHPDHKQTYYLSSFLQLVVPLARPMKLEILGKRICFVGEKDADARLRVDGLNWREILEKAERAFLLLEEQFLVERRQGADRLQQQRMQVQEGQKRLQAVQSQVELLRAEKQHLEDERNRLKAEQQELAQRLEQIIKEKQTLAQTLHEQQQAAQEKIQQMQAPWETPMQRWEQEARRYQAECARLETVLEERMQLEEKRQTHDSRLAGQEGVRQFQAVQRELERQVQNLEAQLAWYRHSLQYRFGEAFWAALRPSWNTLRFPLTSYRLCKEALALLWSRRQRRRRTALQPTLPLPPVGRRKAQNPPTKTQGAMDLLQEARGYLGQVAKLENPYFVLMFSGTTYIQEQRGNRPIRLTTALQEAGVPVFFSYWRWDQAEPIPPPPHPLVFQMPVDMTMQQLSWLLEATPSMKRRLFVVSFPYPPVAKFINWANSLGWVTIYDARDDWEEFQKVGKAEWYDQAVEKYVLANCDFTTAVSRPLQAKLQKLLPEGTVRLSPNALDAKFLHLRQAFPKVETNGRPIVGYVGHLTPAWFDWEGLLELARAEPAWEFEIIGHHAPAGLQFPPNVKYLGAKSHAEVAQTAARWRAAIIPFRVGRLTDAVDPIKVYEYLALGLPVVAFRMPQIKDYPYVWTVENLTEFRCRLKEALSTTVDQTALDHWLFHNLWSTRAQELLRWADEILARRNPLKLLQPTVDVEP